MDTYAGEGGAVVIAPDAGGGTGFRVVARLAPDDWIDLAHRFAD
jgi:hypothetical protein